MNKWLYRAVGAVGVASGALLLSNGVAHAQAANDAKPDLDSQAMRGLVADFFTPMGQHREEFIGGLGGGGGAGNLISGLTSGLSGGGGPGSLLSGLLGGLTGGEGGGLLSGLTGLTGGLIGQGPDAGGPLGGLPASLTGKGKAGAPLGGSLSGGGTLSGGTLSGGGSFGGGSFGGGGTLSGGTLSGGGSLGGPTGGQGMSGRTGSFHSEGANGGSPQSGRAGSPARAAQRSSQPKPDVARRVNNTTGPMAEALIAEEVARQMGLAVETAHEENLPIIGELPGVSTTAGPDASTRGLLALSEVANDIPLVGDVLSGTFDPVDILGDLPFIGPALSGRGKQVTDDTDGDRQQIPFGGPKAASPIDSLGPAALPTDAMPSGAMQLNASPPVITSNLPALDGLPSLLPAAVSQVTDEIAPVLRPADAQSASRAGQATIHVGRHRATERPEVADPELEVTPLVDSLTGVAGSAVGGKVGTLPLSTLMRDMAIAKEVPLVSELGTQLGVLKALPLVGTLTGLVPVESDTAA